MLTSWGFRIGLALSTAVVMVVSVVLAVVVVVMLAFSCREIMVAGGCFGC